VLVLGAGPAGAAAAFFLSHLSEGKLSVLCLERLDEKYSRYHRMCGETVSARAFEDLSPLIPEEVTFRVRRALEHWPGGIDLETPVEGYVLDRPAFLRKVLERASRQGCQLERGSAAEITRKEEGFLVRTRDGRELWSRWLIGADGRSSVVRRTFFPGGPRLLWAEQFVTTERTEQDVMHFHYDQRYEGGYRWVFPHPRGSRVGFTRGSDPRPVALERHVRAIPYGYLLQVSGNACLVGDAAGQVNPITFGGIRMGMVAARMAAEALIGGDLQAYARNWARSPYSSPLYVRAFDALKGMDNAALHRSVRPFRNGYGPWSGLRAILSGKRERMLYRAFDMAAEWGW
jgi:digeranylgeranylglycerophospholipid reductase